MTKTQTLPPHAPAGMRSIRLRAPEQLICAEIEKPRPWPGEALVGVVVLRVVGE